MATTEQKNKLKKILALADIKVDGKRAQDVQIKDERFYDRVFSDGSLGVGEGYMDGWWSSKALDKTMTEEFKADLESKMGLDEQLKLVMYNVGDGMASKHK